MRLCRSLSRYGYTSHPLLCLVLELCVPAEGEGRERGKRGERERGEKGERGLWKGGGGDVCVCV